MKRLIVIAVLALMAAPNMVFAQQGIAVSIRNGMSDPAICAPSSVNVFFNRTSGLLKLCTAAPSTWSAIAMAAAPVPATTCTNQFVSAIATSGAATCTTDTLASVQHANQGTTISLLHGNAAGNPAFGPVVDGDLSLTTPVLGAPTATTIQTSGNVGIGTPPIGTQDVRLDALSAGNVFTLGKMRNTDAADTGSAAGWSAEADTAIARLRANGTANSTSRFGVTIGGYSELISTAGNGLLIGTTNSAPLTLGTSGTSGLTIDTSQNVGVTNQKLTAGTFTVTKSAISPPTVSRYDWTNAMVTALSGTAGDVAVCTLPAKTVVRNAYIVIQTAGGTVTTLSVAVGRTSATYIDYIVASDAKAAANTVYGDASAERGTNLTGYDLPSYTATTLVNAHFISTGGNLSTVTTSTGAIYLETEVLP